MTTASSYFFSISQLPLPPSGHEGDTVYRGVTYGNSDYSSRLIGLDAFSQNAEKPIFPDYRVALNNQDHGVNFLVTSWFMGQALTVDFGFRTGSGTDTVRVFTGFGAEIESARDRVIINAEGKFAYLSRTKVGVTNSPVLYTSGSYNPVILLYSVLADHGGFTTDDIHYDNWVAVQSNMFALGYYTRAKLEGNDLLEFIQAWSQVTGAWIFENGGKLDINFYLPTLPDSWSVVVIDESFYNDIPDVTIGDVSNTLRVYHGLDPTSKIWTGYAEEVSTDSTSTYRVMEKVWDGELVWHATSMSADQFANRELTNRKEGFLKYTVKGGLPLWGFDIGDSVLFQCQSWGVEQESFAVSAWKRNPATRKAELTLMSVEKWSEWFRLDHATYGLLDSSYPLY